MVGLQSGFLAHRLWPNSKQNIASHRKVAVREWGKKLDRLKEVVATTGRILAWDQLRASGRSGSVSADELIAFAQRGDWVTKMLDAATEMALMTQQQWKIFTEALSSRQ